MKYFRARSIQNLIKLYLDVLNQVTRKLDMSSICRVPLWSDIIVLQQSSGVEVMYKRSGCLVRYIRCVVNWIVEDRVREILFCVKVFVGGVDLGNEAHV